MQIIRKRLLTEHGIHSRWQTLRAILNGQQRSPQPSVADGLTLFMCKARHAEAEQLKIYQALKINQRQSARSGEKDARITQYFSRQFLIVVPLGIFLKYKWLFLREV